MQQPKPPLSPELALAAACALLDDAPLAALLDRIMADGGPVWERAIPMAVYHGVDQLLHSRVAHLRPAALPDVIRQDLHARLIRASALQASQARIACRVVQGLEAGGVPALVIKGAGVGHLLYAPNPEFRGSYDVDVLVAPETVLTAQRLLGDLGLERSSPDLDVPTRLRPMLLMLANVTDFREPQLDNTIELHARPTLNPHALPVSFAELHAASVMVDTAYGPLRALDGSANVAYLSHHALNSMVFRLKWFGDIARAERRAGVPCDRYVAESDMRLPRAPSQRVGELLRWFENAIDAMAAGSTVAPPAGAIGHIVRSMEARTHVPVGRSIARLPVEFANLRFTLPLQAGLRAKAYEWLLFASDPRDVTTLRLGSRFAALYGFAGPLLSLGRFVAAAGRRR